MHKICSCWNNFISTIPKLRQLTYSLFFHLFLIFFKLNYFLNVSRKFKVIYSVLMLR